MKPLNPIYSKQLLERILNASDAELRSITILGPATMQLRMSVQDKHRGYDWLDIIFEVDGISDAQLVDDNRLGYVDTSDGISILFEDGKAGLGVGSYASLSSLRDSTLFLIGSGIKYAEAEFSG